uniref:Liprin-beta-2-like n=1 Tax=Salarias fasciatus TaxID=181472 RepID=A0A672HJB2_SALFA
METEASHMLQAALEQMDDIIAGSKAAAMDCSSSVLDLGSGGSCGSGSSGGPCGPLQVLQLAEDLKLALDLQPGPEQRDSLRNQLPAGTVQTLMDWLGGEGFLSPQVNLCSPANNETYQERLLRLEGDKESLVLQVSVLTDQVEAQGEKIRDLESSLEEHRQKLASTEEMLQQELMNRTSLETQKLDLMDEVSYLKLKLVSMEDTHSNTHSQDPADTQQNKAQDLLQETKQLRSKVEELEDEKSQNERRLRETKSPFFPLSDQEYQRLKVGMESLLASNDEKDRRIEELTVLLAQYRKMREAPRGSTRSALHRGSVESTAVRVPCKHAAHTLPSSECVPAGSGVFGVWWRNPGLWRDVPFRSGLRSEAVCLNPVQDPQPELSRFQTLPGKRIRAPERRARPNGDDCGLDLGLSGRSPGFLDVLRISVFLDVLRVFWMFSGSPSFWTFSRFSVFFRIRRSQSGSPVQLHDPDMGDFRRGGFRATAGPRLARSGRTRDLKTPFSEWSPEQVSDWLEDIGLGQYAVLARQWVSGGRTLLSASPQELEKELAMKNPLHRKKLQLRLRTAGGSGGGRPEKSAELDHIWVTRWLDDIGLPQYKDQFNEGRVDGQMLQYLTVNDLLFLKVTSQLHHLSIRSALQVLHLNHFDPDCLKRRPGSESGVSPGDVLQWSNHRVMEWLRSVDLAEYAPNLRGSGVHGGLIILEPRFGADALALLLNISPQKTLLRRHLGSNFSSLVGPAAARRKAEGQGAPGSTLSVTAKVKVGARTCTHTLWIPPLELHIITQGVCFYRAATNTLQDNREKDSLFVILQETLN